MSTWINKLRAGERPGSDDWVEFLKEAHRRAPGMTPIAFGGFRDDAGRNSYDILAQSISCEPGAHVLDLACGDGHLIPPLLGRLGTGGRVSAVDMSEAEVEIGRAKFTDPRVEFHLARAQALPLPDQSVHAVFCHMALMLMAPIEPVISELSRVLKPGGHFAAVMGAAPTGDVLGDILGAGLKVFCKRFPKGMEAQKGDPRVASAEGLAELFSSERGFGPVRLQEFHLNASLNAAGLWRMLRNTYFVSVLDEADHADLRRELQVLAENHGDSAGAVHFKFPIKLIATGRV